MHFQAYIPCKSYRRLADLAELSPESLIVVYCASGMRSASAAQQVRALGYTRVTDAGAMSVAEAEYG